MPIVNQSSIVNRQSSILCCGIVLATAFVYFPVLDHGFLNWDDPSAIADNAALRRPGLVAWAFTTSHMGHYQPLSWIAAGAAERLFGPGAATYHGLALALHLVNTALVFLLAIRLGTLAGARAPLAAASAAAALFALHPLRVEPVAWASAFPYLLALAPLILSTVSYLDVRRASPRLAGATLLRIAPAALYAVSLLVRPLALGFPAVLLLLDAYPLRRASGWARLLVEKVPFVLIAAAAAMAEAWARPVATLEEIGIGARLTLATTAPFVYLWRTVAPMNLTPLDVLPLAPRADWAAILLGAAGVALVTAISWRLRHRHPLLLTAWLAYLILLAPGAGLAPTGLQATADRYAYLPAVAISLAAGAALGALWPGGHQARRAGRTIALSRELLAGGLSMILLGLSLATRQQLAWWGDSVTLWTRAAELDPSNDVALYNLGAALADAGRPEEAMARYAETLRLVPDHDAARRNLQRLEAAALEREGSRLAGEGKLDAAVDRYTAALVRDPARAHARTGRGMALVQLGRYAASVEDLIAGAAAPGAPPEVASALAFALTEIGRPAEAIAALKGSLAVHPDHLGLALNLARLLASTQGSTPADHQLALRIALEASRRTGGRDPRVLDTLASAYAATGQVALARDTADRAAALALEAGDAEMAAAIRANRRAFTAPRR